MKLVFMKRTALETLKSNLPQIYPKYFFLNEVTNLWMTEVCEENPFQKFEEVEKFEFAPLNKNLTLGEVDFQNCKIIYSNLKFLTEAQAADERLWAGLAHENFYDYLRLRWKMNDVTKADKDIAKQIRGRFFFSGGAREAIVRNTLAKYWWVGKLFYDETRKNPFEKLDIIGAVDISTKILHIFTLPAASSPKIMNGIVKFFQHYRDKGIELHNWKNILKPAFIELNKISGAIILDCLSEDEISEILIGEANKLLTK